MEPIGNKQTQPITAEWLKANTEIDGWLAFFVFYLVIAGLGAIVFPILTYNAADYFGSVLLGVRDCLAWWWQSFVAILVVVLLFRRSPSAIFWAKYLMIFGLLGGCLSLWIGGDLGQAISGEVENLGRIVLNGKGPLPSRIVNYFFGFGVHADDVSLPGRMALRGIILSLIGFLYLTFSKRVQTVIPKSYRRVGVRTWICAILPPLFCLAFTCVGIANIDNCYHNYAEIKQSELSAGELTDGHVVFSQLEGWSSDVERINGVNVCSLTNIEGCVVTLYSALYADDSLDGFNQIVADDPPNVDLKKHQVVRDDKNADNGVARYYRVVRYDFADGRPIFVHIACLFDEKTGKVVVVRGGLLDEDVTDFERLLKSVRFTK